MDKKSIKKVFFWGLEVTFLLSLLMTGPATYGQTLIWTQVNDDGFGDINNKGAWPTVVFGDYLYAEASNSITGGEIWRTKGVGGPPFTDWEQVNINGFGDINNEDVSPCVVFGGYLYAGTGNEETGGEIWRTKGVGGPPFTDWEQVNTDGFGDSNNSDTIPIVVFGGYLYTGTGNGETGGEIWRTKGVGGPPFTDWEQVNTDGFGEVNNIEVIPKAVIFGDYLYIEVTNNSTGGEIWRTKGIGSPPFTDWEQVNTDGFGDSYNGDLSLQVFGGSLYAGTENEETGGEIWRTKGIGSPPFTDWEQVNTDGFGDSYNEGIFTTVVFRSYLYAGTENVTTGGGIWRSLDGTTWEQVNTDGFGDANNNKIRPLVVFGDYLYAGTDNETGAGIWRTIGDVINIEMDINLPAGWSLISLPVEPLDATLSTLFPEAVVMYRFERESGYVRVQENEDLQVGSGYWILVYEDQNYVLTGQPIQSYSKTVYSDGWEMIGGCTSGAWPTADSCNIDVIYRFNKETGYQRIQQGENLEPGKGFWILLKDVVNQCELTIGLPFAGTFKYEETYEANYCKSGGVPFDCTVNDWNIIYLKQDGNSITGNVFEIDTVENCCTATSTVPFTGTINGTTATLSAPAMELKCEKDNCIYVHEDNSNSGPQTVAAALKYNGNILHIIHDGEVAVFNRQPKGGQIIDVAGTWTWIEEQYEVFSDPNGCHEIGYKENFTVTITQNEDQLTFSFDIEDDEDVTEYSITGSISDNIISATGTIKLEGDVTLQFTAILAVSEDGQILTGILSQNSNSSDYCTGTFEISATKNIHIADDYFPLNIGDVWQYYCTVTEEDGNTYDEYTYTQIIGTEIFNDIPSIKIKTDVELLTQENEYIYFFITTDGIKLVGWYHIEDDKGKWETIKYDPPILYLKSQFNIGDTWTTTSEVTHEIDGNITESYSAKYDFTILELENLTVPAGTFQDCIKIKIFITYNNEGSDEYKYIWLAEAVGRVKEEGRFCDSLCHYIDKLQYSSISGIIYGTYVSN